MFALSAAAILSFSFWISFSRDFAFCADSASFSSYLAAWASIASSAPSPVTASIRRIPAAIPPSDVILNRPMSPVLEAWIPPHSSVEKSPIDSTRTSSSYFSPNNAIAPFFFADSMSITLVSITWLRRICALTRRSTSFNSAAVTASRCEKSKRRPSAFTSEPFWVTCSPSNWRSAACSKCVAEWFREIAARRSASTIVATSSPVASTPSSITPWCAIALPSFWVSSTRNTPDSVRISPASPHWPPDSA